LHFWQNALPYVLFTIGVFGSGFMKATCKKDHVDAAAATGPFVTTCIDIVGVTAYFSLARLFPGI